MSVKIRQRVDRAVVVLVVSGVLCWMAFVVLATYFASHLEFNCAVPSRQKALFDFPSITYHYFRLYPYCWLMLVGLLCWGAWLVFKHECTVFGVALYTIVAFNIGTLWFLYTLFAFYMINQRFVLGH